MKTLVYLVALLSIGAFAQSKYLTKTGTVDFEASVPSFEDVKAKNSAVTAIINTENGEFAALVLVKGFRFKNALMEEHFNENYAESDKFPKATFKGKLVDFDVSNLKDSYKINGSLSFHGVSKELKNLTCEVIETENGISISGSFVALASDFNIKIPKIVSKKIAENIEVNYSFNLTKK